MKIYLSSSWKNRARVRQMATNLRTEFDATVYDFTDPATRGVPEIPPEKFPHQFNPAEGPYREYIRAFPHWRDAVECNKKALDECDVVILMLPCGNDAHADAYYGLGKGKTLIVVGQPNAGDRTPTHLWADAILDNDEDVFRLLQETKFPKKVQVTIIDATLPYPPGVVQEAKCSCVAREVCADCLTVGTEVEVFLPLKWCPGEVQRIDPFQWVVKMTDEREGTVLISNPAIIRRKAFR